LIAQQVLYKSSATLPTRLGIFCALKSGLAVIQYAAKGKGMSKRIALIVIGRYKEEWQTLSPNQQSEFIARVGRATTLLGLVPITGYRLTSAPGTFMEIWETNNSEALERAVKNLDALGYTRYVEARWFVGERQAEEPANQETVQRTVRPKSVVRRSGVK
jgi:hypothetical protein